MADMKGFSNVRLHKAGTILESVPGHLEVSADMPALNATTITLTPTEAMTEVAELGQGQVTSKARESLHYTGEVNFAGRFKDLEEQIRRGNRDAAVPTEVPGLALTVSLLTGAAHLDGTTGDQIVFLAGNGAFDALLAASSDVDLRNLFIYITGSAADDASAIGPKMIKPGSPYDDGADTRIDISPRFTNAASGIGSGFTGEASVAVTLDVGAATANQPFTAGSTTGEPTYSLVGELRDVGPKFIALTGVVWGPMSINVGGRGVITASQPFIAKDYIVLTDTNPNTGGVVDDTALTYNEPLKGGSDIAAAYLATDTKTVILASPDACGITTAAFNASGDNSPVINCLGSTGLNGTFPNAMNLDAAMDYNVGSLADATSISRAIQLIGEATEKATFSVHFLDIDGNIVTVTHANGAPMSSTIAALGGDSDAVTTGNFSLASHGDRDFATRTQYFQFLAA